MKRVPVAVILGLVALAAVAAAAFALTGGADEPAPTGRVSGERIVAREQTADGELRLVVRRSGADGLCVAVEPSGSGYCSADRRDLTVAADDPRSSCGETVVYGSVSDRVDHLRAHFMDGRVRRVMILAPVRLAGRPVRLVFDAFAGRPKVARVVAVSGDGAVLATERIEPEGSVHCLPNGVTEVTVPQ